MVHRFTQNMLQNASRIKLDPRVQVVINMDGWGQPWLKFDTYKNCEVDQPVQFTGFKLFFHNDTRKGDAILAPQEVLALRPRPMLHPVPVALATALHGSARTPPACSSHAMRNSVVPCASR